MKRKPTIYLDTNILSVLAYRGGNVATLHQQMMSREWWEIERKSFRVYASVFTEGELRQGTYRGQKQSLAVVRRLPYLPFTQEVKACAKVYLEKSVIPLVRPGDAIQLAFATIYRLDYLLTWNYAHLANLDTQRKLTLLNQRLGWRTPYLVSPETIPRAALGQTIRRKDDEPDS